jgi:hypothetical protein
VVRPWLNFTEAQANDGTIVGLRVLRSPIKQTKGDAMRNHPKVAKSASRVDAWAILFIIVLVVGAAVFWVNHQ